MKINKKEKKTQRIHNKPTKLCDPYYMNKKTQIEEKSENIMKLNFYTI